VPGNDAPVVPPAGAAPVPAAPANPTRPPNPEESAPRFAPPGGEG
jgi:hypothetical protein